MSTVHARDLNVSDLVIWIHLYLMSLYVKFQLLM